MPSSFTRDHSRALEYSSRLPVSVCGTVIPCLKLRGFSWQHGLTDFGQKRPRHHVSRIPGRICLSRLATRLNRHTNKRPSYPPASPHRNTVWYRNVDLFPIDYAFRPRLRGWLTLRRLALRRNPWSFGESVSHTLYRYSCQHSHFRYLQPTSRLTFTGLRNAPLPLAYASPDLRHMALAPLHFPRRIA